MNTARQLTRHRNGFSLSELMVVLAIIAILVAMSMAGTMNLTLGAAVQASALELQRSFQLAQRLAVVYQMPHVVAFNTNVIEYTESGALAPGTGTVWDPTGEHHWYVIIGPQESGAIATSADYYQGETVDPDGIQIGPHRHLRPGVRFWHAWPTTNWYNSTDRTPYYDFDPANENFIQGFSKDSSTGWCTGGDMRQAAEPACAYTDWAVNQYKDGKDVICQPNYQFSRDKGTNTGSTTIYCGVVAVKDISYRRVLTMEENTGRVTIDREAKVAW